MKQSVKTPKSARNSQNPNRSQIICPSCTREVEVSARTFVAHDIDPRADNPVICEASGQYVKANQKWMSAA